MRDRGGKHQAVGHLLILTATFSGCSAALSVKVAGAGAGTVSSVPAGISCGAGATACTSIGNPGATWTLTATASSGSQFVGWAGSCSGTSASCSVTLNNAPVAIAYFRTTQVAAGAWHSCALKVNGTVECWGRNNEGELGQGYVQATTPGFAYPVPIIGNVAAISAGAYHTCVLIADGSIQCWGSNTYEQVRNASGADPLTSPTWVRSMPNTLALGVAAGGYHTCELMSDNTVSCWGDDHFSQLSSDPKWANGIGTAVPVLNVSNAIALSAGAYHTCALLSGGGADCWGYDNDGETGPTAGPFNALSISAVQIDAATGAGVNGASNFGGYHTCAVMTNGTVTCWGYNGYGELGNGTNAAPQPVGSPVTPTLSGTATMVSAGGYHTCAIVSGSISCWGANDSAQLGRGNWGGAVATPGPISGNLPTALSIDAGAYHTCAVFSGTDDVRCWGRNNEGESGDSQGAAVTTPRTPDHF